MENNEKLPIGNAVVYFASRMLNKLQGMDLSEILDDEDLSDVFDEDTKKLLATKDMDPFAKQFFITGFRMGMSSGLYYAVNKVWQIENITSDTINQMAEGKEEIEHTLGDEVRAMANRELVQYLGHGNCEKCIAKDCYCNEYMLLDGKTCEEIVAEALAKPKVAQNVAL